jgi:exonuclease V gamma subunit
MRTAKPNGSAELERSLEKDIAGNIRLTRANTAFRQVENGNDETSSSDLGTLLHRVAEAPAREVEVLIDHLHGLLNKLQSDEDRIQSDIERYAELNQGVTQLAAIISDSVKKIPGAPNQ